VAVEKPQPVPTPDTRYYWEAAQRGVLALQKCMACDRHFFYPRSHCPVCLGNQITWTVASGRATLHTYVISHIPAPGFEDEAPYVIAVVELEEGPRMMTNLVGIEPRPELLELDMPLQVEFAAQGSIVVPKFRPIEPSP
jgi:uncharacterized OB-fold protein